MRRRKSCFDQLLAIPMRLGEAVNQLDAWSRNEMECRSRELRSRDRSPRPSFFAPAVRGRSFVTVLTCMGWLLGSLSVSCDRAAERDVMADAVSDYCVDLQEALESARDEYARWLEVMQKPLSDSQRRRADQVFGSGTLGRMSEDSRTTTSFLLRQRFNLCEQVRTIPEVHSNFLEGRSGVLLGAFRESLSVPQQQAFLAELAVLAGHLNNFPLRTR
jgi:hypothetical protein